MKLSRYEILGKNGRNKGGIFTVLGIKASDFVNWLPIPPHLDANKLESWFTEIGECQFLDGAMYVFDLVSHEDKVLRRTILVEELRFYDLAYEDEYQVIITK